MVGPLERNFNLFFETEFLIFEQEIVGFKKEFPIFGHIFFLYFKNDFSIFGHTSLNFLGEDEIFYF